MGGGGGVPSRIFFQEDFISSPVDFTVAVRLSLVTKNALFKDSIKVLVFSTEEIFHRMNRIANFIIK